MEIKNVVIGDKEYEYVSHMEDEERESNDLDDEDDTQVLPIITNNLEITKEYKELENE